MPLSSGIKQVLQNIKTNWKRSRRKIQAYLLLFTFLLLFLIVYFFHYIFISVYPGEAGVLWRRFSGTEMRKLYEEGFHIIFPWNKMYVYNTRIQNTSFIFEALSKDGLPIIFELSVRYYPNRDKLPQLHRMVGPNYAEKIVEPEVQAHLRKVVANYIPEEIYTSEGYLLQIIMQGALGALAERHIILDDLLIRRMVLPSRIRNAIESKLAQEQISLEYEFRLERETKEAQRKKIEAGGIRDFQELVKEGNYFDKYLLFKGIEATLELSRSPNAKVVLIGGGQNGLPLIMNMDSVQGAGLTSSASGNPDPLKVFPNVPTEGLLPNDATETVPFSKPLPDAPSLKSEPPRSATPDSGSSSSFLFREKDDKRFVHQSDSLPDYSEIINLENNPILPMQYGRITSLEPSMRESGQWNSPIPGYSNRVAARTSTGEKIAP